MPQKDLHYRITGDPRSFEDAGSRTRSEMSKMERESRRLERQQRELQATMEHIGRGMVIAGAAIAAGLALTVKAAIDWETAWAGVLKTVDGTDAQMAALEEDIRALTAVLPASHEEIAAVASAAGQLGVQRENVTQFTRTMIDMGEATNLAATDAATALARLMNIMQTAPQDVDKLGSAIVDLGNNSATTEAEIVEMGLRIAGAGNTIGLAESDVVAFAAALSSVGIRAQAGGTAISRVFLEIDKSVQAGGASLDTFARTAGMSADEFARAYEQDAAAAIATFITGLGEIQASGGDVNGVLEELGLTEIRVSDALRRLAGSGDLLNQSLDRSSRAWDENTALTEEAERRYETTAARLQIAQNQLNEFAIEMGGTFLPIVGEAADALSSFLGFISGMPDPIKNVIGILGAGTAAMLLLGGTVLIAGARVARFRLELALLQAQGGATAVAAGRMVTGIRRTMVWAGRATAAVVGLQIAAAALNAALGKDLSPQVNALGEGLSRWADKGQVAGETARLMGDDMGKLNEALKQLNSSGFEQGIVSFIEWFSQTGQIVDESFTRSKERIEAVDQALVQLVQSGRGQEAAEIFERLAEMGERHGHSVEEMKELLPGYAGALEVASAAGENAAGSINEVGEAAQSAAEDVEALQEAFDQLFGATMSLDRATIAYKEGIQELKDALGEGTSTLDVNTEAGRNNRSAVLDQIDAIADLRQANIDNGMSIDTANEKYDNQLGRLEKILIERGFEKEAVKDLIESYRDIPEVVSTQVQTPGLTQAENGARRLKRQLDAIDRFVTISFQTSGAMPRGGLQVARQHGGEIPGPLSAPPDSVMAAVTPGEFVVRQSVAQPNLAALRALNATGRLPVSGIRAGDGAAVAGGRVVVPDLRVFIGDRELTDIVRVEVGDGISAHDRQLKRRAWAGSGAAR